MVNPGCFVKLSWFGRQGKAAYPSSLTDQLFRQRHRLWLVRGAGRERKAGRWGELHLITLLWLVHDIPSTFTSSQLGRRCSVNMHKSVDVLYPLRFKVIPDTFSALFFRLLGIIRDSELVQDWN